MSAQAPEQAMGGPRSHAPATGADGRRPPAASSNAAATLAADEVAATAAAAAAAAMEAGSELSELEAIMPAALMVAWSRAETETLRAPATGAVHAGTEAGAG